LDSLYLLLLFALTSVALVAVGARVLGLRATSLRGALARVLELSGFTVLLTVVNVAAGFLLVLALRFLTGTFVSLYLNTDAMLVLMSVLQAAALQWWIASRDGDDG